MTPLPVGVIIALTIAWTMIGAFIGFLIAAKIFGDDLDKLSKSRDEYLRLYLQTRDLSEHHRG